MTTETNKLADLIIKKSEREWKDKASRAKDAFMRDLRAVGHTIYIENGSGEKKDLSGVLYRIVDQAFEVQKEAIHQNALREFFDQYNEISKFMHDEQFQD